MKEYDVRMILQVSKVPWYQVPGYPTNEGPVKHVFNKAKIKLNIISIPRELCMCSPHGHKQEVED